MKKEIEKFLVENTPAVKKRGWILKLIWKTFHYFEVEDISKIWEIYNSLKSIIINLTPENKKIKPYWNAKCVNLQSKNLVTKN